MLDGVLLTSLEKCNILNNNITHILHTYLSGNISQSLNVLNIDK
mgnify:CR=1 FL=1